MSSKAFGRRLIEGGVALIWALGGSVVTTLLLSPALLALTLTLDGELAQLPWSLGTIMRNYFQLLGYLLSPWTSTLHMTDFPTSPSAAFHFMEVKHLFWLAFAVFVMFSGLLFFWLQERSSQEPSRWLSRTLDVVMGIPFVLVALIIWQGFDRIFVGFHHLLFNNSAWLFDPATDPIILVLSETFFLICALSVMMCYEFGLWWLRRSLLKR